MDNGFIDVKHIQSKINIADVFTKEIRDKNHFKLLTKYIVQDPPKKYAPSYEVKEGIGMTDRPVSISTSTP